MKKVVVGFVSAAALATIGMAAASNSMAASQPAFSNNNATGVFVSGNLGYSTIDIQQSYYNDPITGEMPTSFKADDLAWAANLGYQFNQYLALEAGYISFGQAKANTAINNTPVTASDTLGGFDANVKGIMPINSKFNVFAKFGVVNMHDDEDVSNNQASLNAHGDSWSPLLGAGAAYNINKNIALTVQDAYALKTTYKKDGVNIDMPAANAVLAGMSFKFNL